MVLVPHFAVPFSFGPAAAPHARVVEQDSIDEIAGCVAVIWQTPLGSRPERPDFGVIDTAFTPMPSDVSDDLSAAIAAWEPRADVVIEDDLSLVAQMTLRLRGEVAA